MQTINLKNKCSEDLAELERLHYESVTKEKVIGAALAASNGKGNNAAIDNYYNDYYNSFVQYEKTKQLFFKNHIAEYTTNLPEYTTWEINFATGDLILYD